MGRERQGGHLVLVGRHSSHAVSHCQSGRRRRECLAVDVLRSSDGALSAEGTGPPQPADPVERGTGKTWGTGDGPHTYVEWRGAK